MALKVVLILFVAMLLFANNNAEIVGDAASCLKSCSDQCFFMNPICLGECLVKCAGQYKENENHVCNVGCSLGHCYKYLINKYDNDKFGSCMTGCNENYCIKKIALNKA